MNNIEKEQPAIFRRRYLEFQYILDAVPTYENLFDYPLTHEKKWVIRRGIPWPNKTLAPGIYPYIVMPSGEVRISFKPRPETKIHHPELSLNGKPVIAAGMLSWNNQEIIHISNESGHYCPQPDCVDIAVIALRFWNVPISQQLEREQWWGCIDPSG